MGRVGKYARVTTAAVASSEITARNQVARDRTSLVTRCLHGSKRGNERPAVHVDNQAPGGDYRWSGVRKKEDGGRRCWNLSAFNNPHWVLRFIVVELKKLDSSSQKRRRLNRACLSDRGLGVSATKATGLSFTNGWADFCSEPPLSLEATKGLQFPERCFMIWASPLTHVCNCGDNLGGMGLCRLPS